MTNVKQATARTTTKADPSGMTNKRTKGQKDKQKDKRRDKQKDKQQQKQPQVLRLRMTLFGR
jgi:hypothetical protein